MEIGRPTLTLKFFFIYISFLTGTQSENMRPNRLSNIFIYFNVRHDLELDRRVPISIYYNMFKFNFQRFNRNEGLDIPELTYHLFVFAKVQGHFVWSINQ